MNGNETMVLVSGKRISDLKAAIYGALKEVKTMIAESECPKADPLAERLGLRQEWNSSAWVSQLEQHRAVMRTLFNLGIIGEDEFMYYTHENSVCSTKLRKWVEHG